MKNYENYISKSEIEKIHEYTLRILSEIGIKFEHEGALTLFKNTAQGSKTKPYLSPSPFLTRF